MRERIYENEVPIDGEMEVLRLLVRGWNDRTVRRLHVGGREPYLEVAVYSSGYTREEYTSSRYYKVTPAVVALLKSGGYVKGTPHWGYTDDNVLKVSRHGEEAFYAFRREQEAEEERGKKAKKDRGVRKHGNKKHRDK